MDLSRRDALGCLALGPGLRLADPAAPDDDVRFKLKGVIIDACDAERRTLSMSLGERRLHPPKLVEIPAAKEISVRVSHEKPGAVNNLPFGWDRVRELIGKPVSMKFRVDGDGLSVLSIASAND